ncbi:hypothetical protein F8M41_008082 [Gigaspora margarita]|uniref:Uncharacterized protein n=1 Tax=Gigaspora margarita TaxID=4874 RepID=A0A8H4A3X5_GIGMA|nr:hypothetical protein F8M41_008082 [Gigaspora margarita]
MEEIVFEDYDQANEFEGVWTKPFPRFIASFKEIVVRWFEFDDEYDLVIDLLKETGDRKKSKAKLKTIYQKMKSFR